jgi:nucleoside-diphosphate-sugar epimerase
MAKVLVTGATGMVGAHVCLQLLNYGHEVKAMKRAQSDTSWFDKIFEYYNTKISSNLSFIEASLLDLVSLEKAMNNVDVIVHCAAKVSFSKKDENDLYESNHQGTTNLVNSALHFPNIHFIHISSVAALGNNPVGDVEETTKWKSYPNTSAYSITKYMAEMEVWRAKEEGLQVSILNPSYILGPGNWYTGSSNLFRRIKKGFPYFTEGVTGFVDVRDVAEAVIKVIDKKQIGENFIINAENLSYKEILTKIAEKGNYKTPSKALSKKLLKLFNPLISLYFFFNGKSNPLNAALIHSLFSKKTFSNEKSTQVLNIQYKTIDECIEHSWEFFNKNFD